MADKTVSISGELAKVALHLKSVPELVRLAEKGAEANRHGRRNRPPAMYNLIDGARSNPYRAAHGVLGNPHRLEVFLKQNFTWCNRSAHFHQRESA